jgi:SLOG cluster2/TIR domain
MPNPVRLYVLHHPTSEAARQLTDYIYNWFRLPNLEGIPVYLRSASQRDNRPPALPEGGEGVLEYLIPLVDAEMVRDVGWHDYLQDLEERCLKPPSMESSPTEGWVMFPVALDGTAYNLPASVARRNFIRHLQAPDKPTSDEEKKLAFEATQETLKHLTEALSRDLNARLFPKQANEKLKIFISYARADGTEAPKKLRDYIQGQTQCSAFFDENDISFGESFGQVLQEGVGERARALIVVSGDNYADRPWCRWEIGRFMQANRIPVDPRKRGKDFIEAYHPVLVLDIMEGNRTGRVIPELGQVPSLRWAPGRELLAFSMLIRDVFFGARNVLTARSHGQAINWKKGPVVNRLPGPIMLQRLLNQRRYQGTSKKICSSVSYPGNGLPLLELRLLESLFPKTHLVAFRDVDRHLPEPMQAALKKKEHPLDGKVLAVSFGDSPQLAELGYLSQHLDEAVIYLLRPLVRLGIDLLYGGLPPKRTDGMTSMPPIGLPPHRNMTLTLLNLLNDERSTDQTDLADVGYMSTSMRTARLYNPSAWPNCDRITVEDEAAWINTCSILRVLPKDAGFRGQLPDKTADPDSFSALQATVLSEMRRRLAEGFDCAIPRDTKHRIKPTAFVFTGGKVSGFSGVMPGVMEEFLRATEQQLPVYLLGGLGGAAGTIAHCLSTKADRPPEFTAAFYSKPETPDYQKMLAGLGKIDSQSRLEPDRMFDELWKVIEQGRDVGLEALFRNGLNTADNQELITTTDTMRAVHLVWRGLNQLFF